MRSIVHELTDTTLVARFRELEVHLVHGPEAPATLEEIGRIREYEYRRVGAGRGGFVDLDRHDTQWPWYSQLVSWDPEHREIVAMYRAIRCRWALQHGGLDALRTSALFSYSDEFVSEYLEHSVELGRSVVNSDAHRAISGLFSVWVGLGAMVNEWREVGYFFGNISLYRTLPDAAVDAIVDYLVRFHSAPPGLVMARVPTGRWRTRKESGDPDAHGSPSAAEAFAALQAEAKEAGWSVPPILLSYLKAHPGMFAFDIASDDDFGGALEVAIAVPVAGLSSRTVNRFIAPYQSVNPSRFLPAKGASDS